jgi:hypothetical protein
VLLAIDLGLRTGLATYGRDGRLRTYRSQNFGTRTRLKRAAAGVLRAHDGCRVLVVEGDASLARIWGRAAEQRGASVVPVTPEVWRGALLRPSEPRSGADAKRAADRLARAVIDWADVEQPTSLRHDAAEAILIGLWAVLRLGWLEELPDELR